MENKTFKQRIIDMEKGDTLAFPITIVGYSTIRSYASDLGFEFGRKYVTRRDRENRTYTITRLS